MLTPYAQLPDTTRVWIYQSNVSFKDTDIPKLRNTLQTFAKNWVSHNKMLRTYADVYHNQFIVLMVDESLAGASGCSIDSSVRFMQQLQAEYKVNLFDRMCFAYLNEDKIKTASRDEFSSLYQQKHITDETLVFNNLVNTKLDFEQKWQVQLGDSWHKRMV